MFERICEAGRDRGSVWICELRWAMSREIPSGLAKGLIGKEIPCCGVLRGHGSSVLCVTFDPEGQTVCSGSEDGELRLWRVVNGQWQVRHLARQRAAIFQRDIYL
jgi:hypothetical protein